MSAWAWITAAVLLDGVVGLVGGLLPEPWVQRSRGLVPFAAGAMLGAAFLDVLPEVADAIGAHAALAWALGGFTMTAVAEAWVARRGGVRVTGPALLVSDALHNLGDGAVIAAAFLSSTRLGLATTFAVILHEMPQEVGDYALLRSAGVTRRRALGGLAAIQLTAGLGAAVVVAGNWLQSSLHLALAVAGGMFVYIAAIHFLPVLHQAKDDRERFVRLAAFLVGLAVPACVGASGAWPEAQRSDPVRAEASAEWAAGGSGVPHP